MAEKVWATDKNSGGWRSTLDNMAVHPSLLDAYGVPSEGSSRAHKYHVDKGPHAHSLYNKSRNPVKTSAPAPAIVLDNAHLTERIDGLQNLALVGPWHFPEMNDNEMRKWIAAHWKPVIGYTPIISHLMKEWYCFH